ncbi:MAG: hypothetical protein OXC65_02345 [Thiotrichales bacterium]|nr:hypothetical protein [Thiotrichales bacterium]
MAPVPTSPPPPPAGPAWRDRLAVLGGLAYVATLTPALLALGADAAVIQALWMTAVVWTVLAAIAGALTRSLRHGDWRAWRGGPAPDRTEEDEWATQTGRYTYLRDDDEEEVVHRGSDAHG